MVSDQASEPCSAITGHLSRNSITVANAQKRKEQAKTAPHRCWRVDSTRRHEVDFPFLAPCIFQTLKEERLELNLRIKRRESLVSAGDSRKGISWDDSYQSTSGFHVTWRGEVKKSIRAFGSKQ